MNEMIQVFGAVGSRSQQTTNIRGLEGTLLQAVMPSAVDHV